MLGGSYVIHMIFGALIVIIIGNPREAVEAEGAVGVLFMLQTHFCLRVHIASQWGLVEQPPSTLKIQKKAEVQVSTRLWLQGQLHHILTEVMSIKQMDILFINGMTLVDTQITKVPELQRGNMMAQYIILRFMIIPAHLLWCTLDTGVQGAMAPQMLTLRRAREL